jgi:hypothetical protein
MLSADSVDHKSRSATQPPQINVQTTCTKIQEPADAQDAPTQQCPKGCKTLDKQTMIAWSCEHETLIEHQQAPGLENF